MLIELEWSLRGPNLLTVAWKYNDSKQQLPDGGDQAQQRGGLPNNLLESSCFNINIPPRTSKEDARAIFEFSSYLARSSFPPFKTKDSNDFLKQNSFAAAACCKSSVLFTLLEQHEDSNRMEMNREQMEDQRQLTTFPRKKTAQHCARPDLDAAERGGKYAKKRNLTNVEAVPFLGIMREIF